MGNPKQIKLNIDPALEDKAIKRSQEIGIDINQFMIEAITYYLKSTEEPQTKDCLLSEHPPIFISNLSSQGGTSLVMQYLLDRARLRGIEITEPVSPEKLIGLPTKIDNFTGHKSGQRSANK